MDSSRSGRCCTHNAKSPLGLERSNPRLGLRMAAFEGGAYVNGTGFLTGWEGHRGSIRCTSDGRGWRTRGARMHPSGGGPGAWVATSRVTSAALDHCETIAMSEDPAREQAA